MNVCDIRRAMENSTELDDLSQSYATAFNWTDDYLDNLDTSQYPFPNTLWHVKEAKDMALKSSFMVTIAASGIFLNSVILIIIIRNKWLWSASNILVGNLAFVDMLTLLVCPWFMLVRDFYQQFILGNIGCRLDGFLQSTFLLASVEAVVMVSYDRLAATALTSDARITKSAAPKLVVASWFSAITLSFPWIFERYYVERQWLDYLETFCVEDMNYLGVYWHIILTLLVWVPLGLLVVTYGGIMWRLERSARKLKVRNGGRAIGRARNKAMRITACVLLAATVCRLPYTILFYWRNNMDKQINAVEGAYDIMWFAANYLMYANCAINPLIYGFTNQRFRRAMDRTPVISWFKFGLWCCVCSMFQKKTVQIDDKNTEKIFVIESSPKQKKKIKQMMRNILHIHKETLEFSVPQADDMTNKPTKLTPVKSESPEPNRC